MYKFDLSVLQLVIGLVCLGSISAIAVLSFLFAIPEENAAILSLITGALLTVGMAQVIGFLFQRRQ